MNGTAKTTTGKVKLFSTFQGVETGKYINPLTIFEWKSKQLNWLQLPDNTWVNCGSAFQYVNILTYPTATPPPPPPPPPVTDVFPPEVGITIGTVTKWYIPK